MVVVIRRSRLKLGKIALAFVIAIFFSLQAKVASAHILKTDGSISMNLHIEPDHSPIAGETAYMFLSFNDTDGKFLLENCVCVFKVYEGNEEIESKEFDLELVEYVFPEINIYKIVFEGTPKEGEDFQSFSLEYNVRVERTSEKVQTETSDDPSYVYGVIVLVIAGSLIYKYKLVKRRGGDKN